MTVVLAVYTSQNIFQPCSLPFHCYMLFHSCSAGLVKSRPLDRWRETLAVLAAYTSSDNFFELCDLLARRLATAGLPHAATLTWICAANVDKAVKQWTAVLKKPGPGREAGTAALQARTDTHLSFYIDDIRGGRAACTLPVPQLDLKLLCG